MGPADPTAPTGQQQTPKGPVQMSTEIESTPKDISVFFQDVLKKIWEDETDRSSDTYIKKQQFVYFWDTRTVEHRSK